MKPDTSQSEGAEKWQKLIAEAKNSHHWEEAVAGSNLQINLYRFRKQHGYTQRDVGRAIGVKQPHIVRHESWGYMPSMESLAKYAHLYGITIADLLSEPSKPNPETLYAWSKQDREYKEIGSVKYFSSSHTVTRAVEFEGIQQLGDMS